MWMVVDGGEVGYVDGGGWWRSRLGGWQAAWMVVDGGGVGYVDGRQRGWWRSRLRGWWWVVAE